MMLWQEDMAHDLDRITLTPAEYLAYRDSVRGFASVAQLWNTSDVIGRQIAIHVTPNQARVVSVVGVVGDLRQFRDTAPHATLYSSTLGQSTMTSAIRSNLAIDTVSQTVQHSLAEVDSGLALTTGGPWTIALRRPASTPLDGSGL